MNYNRPITALAFTIGLLIIPWPHALQGENIFNDDYTSFDIFDDFDNPEFNEFIDNTNFLITRQFDPETVMEILNLVGIPALLEQEFYLRTAVITTRDILDLPAFIEDLHYCHKTVFGCNFFYDQTSEARLGHQSTKISKYLALTDDNFIQAIDNTAQQIQERFGVTINIAPTDVFPLFKNAKVQERRLGGMFHFSRQHKCLKFLLNTPFYYRERNFFLTEEEQDDIEAILGATTPEEQKKFQKAHFISDKLGFGDTRLVVRFPLIKSDNYSLHGGLQATIPTAFAVAKGLLGSSFKSNTQQPTLDYVNLINLADDPDTRDQASKIGSDFFLGAIDRLAAMLLDTGLGNNGHLGLGLNLYTTYPLSTFIPRPWAESIIIKGKVSLEYLCPGMEKRYYVQNNIQQQFDEHDFFDESQASQNLAFLEQQTVERFYPFVFDTMVHPGLIFIWTSRATYETKRFAFHLGTDTYLKTRERFGTIYATGVAKDTLDIEKARNYLAYQGTVFASVAYKINRPCNDLIISLHFADVISGSGIGNQFTLALNIEKNF